MRGPLELRTEIHPMSARKGGRGHFRLGAERSTILDVHNVSPVSSVCDLLSRKMDKWCQFWQCVYNMKYCLAVSLSESSYRLHTRVGLWGCITESYRYNFKGSRPPFSRGPHSKHVSMQPIRGHTGVGGRRCLSRLMYLRTKVVAPKCDQVPGKIEQGE